MKFMMTVKVYIKLMVKRKIRMITWEFHNTQKIIIEEPYIIIRTWVATIIAVDSCLWINFIIIRSI